MSAYMLLLSVTGGKQNDSVFQENDRLLGKMFISYVGRCGKKYLCKVSMLRLHKQRKIIEQSFKLNVYGTPFAQ